MSSEIPKNELPPKIPPTETPPEPAKPLVEEKPLVSEIPPSTDVPPKEEVPTENPLDVYMDKQSEKLSGLIDGATDKLEHAVSKTIDLTYNGVKKGIKETPVVAEKIYKGASSILESAYKELYKIPEVNRLVGKLEIGYNQFWADKHEEKAVALKGEMDSCVSKISNLDETKSKLLSIIESLGSRGEKFMLTVRDIDRQREDYVTKQERIHTKLEARQETIDGYMGKRDLVADRLIGYYDKELGPMNEKIEKLGTERNEYELAVTVTELRHRQLEEQNSFTEARKKEIEALYRSLDMTDKEIRKDPGIMEFEAELKSSREKMRKEREVLAEKRLEIDERVAKAEAKANPYRDERNEFVRVTKRGKIDIKVAPKVDEIPYEGRKDVDRTGAPLPKEEYRETTRARNVILDENLPAGGFAGEGASRVEGNESNEDKRPKLEAYVTEWNKLPGNIKNADLLPKIDNVDFYRTLKGLNKDFKLSMSEFKKVLTGYYKVKGKLTGPAKVALDRAFPAWEAEIKRVNKRNKS